MINLAPQIYRQRVTIEGIPEKPISSDDIKTYLSELSKVVGMVKLIEPVTHLSPKFGWSGWVHWETSGAHFYAWDDPVLFFSVDAYTCKKFDAQIAADFTRQYFNCSQLQFKEA